MKTTLSFTVFAGLLGLLVVAGCQPQQATMPSTGAAFHELSLDAALKQAKTEDKVVMIDFYADWCPPCKELDRTTWRDDKVQEWLRAKTVAIKINVDKAPELQAKFKFDGIPTIVFLKPEGSEVGRFTGYRGPAEFLKDADNILAVKKY